MNCVIVWFGLTLQLDSFYDRFNDTMLNVFEVHTQKLAQRKGSITFTYNHYTT